MILAHNAVGTSRNKDHGIAFGCSSQFVTIRDPKLVDGFNLVIQNPHFLLQRPCKDIPVTCGGPTVPGALSVYDWPSGPLLAMIF